VIAFYVWLAVLLFDHYRYWLPTLLPVVGAWFMTHVCLITYRVRVEQKEKRRIRSIFSKIVSPNVVNELLTAEQVALGGARRNVTIYFADIRGFTRMTDEIQAEAEAYIREHLLPAEVAESYLDKQASELLATVSLYLSLIVDTIKRHSGTFDKYIGDCVLAFWGAPIPNDQHALQCVRAAIDAQRAIYELNLQRAAENKRREQANVARLAAGQPPYSMHRLLALGSGITTGTVTVGLMGSDENFNYTVLGREVNLASRLEGVSGRGRIVISDSTCKELQRLDPELAATCIELPPQEVKGFRDAVKIYEVQWRQMDTEMQAYDTSILTAARATPPTDIITPTGS
jgi:adenylate cyclase